MTSSKHRSKSISKRQRTKKIETHLPTASDIKKLCDNEGLLIKDKRVLKILKSLYRTFLIKIVKSVYQNIKNKRATYDDIILSLTSLFGARIHSMLDDVQIVVKPTIFKRMLNDVFELFLLNKFISPKYHELIQKAVEVCVSKAFLAPISSWELENRGQDAYRYVTLELLKKVNQVHLVSGSEYYSPSIVKSADGFI